MITLCHPFDNSESLLIQAALRAEGIPFHVVGEHFATLFPGVETSLLNQRSIQVPELYLASATQVVSEALTNIGGQR